MPTQWLARGWFGVVALGIVGCTTASSGTGGTGGTGGGSSSSSSTSTSTSTSSAHDDTTVPCKQNPCNPDELCGVCHYALGEGHQCHEKDVPDAASFACDWLACAADEACVHVAPLQDGCFEAACEPLPQDCGANPTCACVEAAIEQIKPDGLFNYDVTSCAVDSGHASVTAVVGP